MKKIIITLATVIAAMALAANASAQLSVGAGYGLASHTAVDKTPNSVTKADPTNMSGFYVGAAYGWNFLSRNWGDLSLQPGLTYSFYGKCIEQENTNVEGFEASYKGSRRDHYLDVPVHVKYAYDVVPGTLKLSAFAGPVFSFGLGATLIEREESGDNYSNTRFNMYTGKFKTTGKLAGNKFSESGGDGDTNYSMFDIKLGLGISATLFEMFDVRIAYNLGLLDRMTEKVEGYNRISHTNVFQIGVAYNF